MKRMKQLVISVSLAASMWGCNDSSPTSPPGDTPRPGITYTLSGVVSEVTPSGQAPVVAALVELNSRQQVILPVRTDINGSYRFDGVYPGLAHFRVKSEVHEISSRELRIEGDTRLDVQLARRPTFILSGVVSEMTPNGLAPVEGVKVDDSYFHAEAATDTNGFYTFAGYLADQRVFLAFTKEGYGTVTRDVTINGNTRLDLQLVRE